jgi:hypothetical protein
VWGLGHRGLIQGWEPVFRCGNDVKVKCQQSGVLPCDVVLLSVRRLMLSLTLAKRPDGENRYVSVCFHIEGMR